MGCVRANEGKRETSSRRNPQKFRNERWIAAVDLYTPTYLETIYTAHESVALSLKETALNFHALYICSRVGDQ